MDIHHCPRCELRFANDSEVRDHLVTDHHLDPEVVARRLPGWQAEMAERRDAPDLVGATDPNRKRDSR